MKKNYILLCGITLLLFIYSCKQQTLRQDIHIVPKPQSYTLHEGSFILDKNTVLHFDGNNDEIFGIFEIFRNTIKESTGFFLDQTDILPSKNVIVFRLDPACPLNDEGYTLHIEKKRIEITAKTTAGLFYGMQSLLQLFPPEIFNPNPNESSVSWEASCIEIVDQPYFPYRGSHLDVARHFFHLDSIKRHIDHLARNKMNRFHWHLTDDQGWRLEIKRYPKLTEVGGCRKETLIGSYANDVPHRYDGKEYCGFYTQEEAREIVRYAAERFITVIPEIELPGHALAALSAYPELSCDPQKKYEAATTWGVFEDVFCPNETTFSFFEEVFTEVMDIFPSEYIHIGGDECPKKVWKESPYCQQLIKKLNLHDEEGLQSYFIQRMETFLNQHGRKIIGWDEILEGGLAEHATVMSWRGLEGGIEAATQGHDVIMAPTSHCYLDYYQSDPQTEPLAIGGFTTLNKVYHFNPVPEEIPSDKGHHIVGVQCNLWTEYIKTYSKAEYMEFPRLLAIAETGWTAPEYKDWGDFCRRLPYQLKLLEMMGVRHGTISFNIKFYSSHNDKGIYEIALTSEIAHAEIAYTTNGSEPTLQSPRYTNPIEISETTVIKAVPVFNGAIMGAIQEKEIRYHKAVGKKISYEKLPDSKYPGGEENGLIDGMKGSKNFGDGFWQGFFGYDCNVIIDLEKPEKLSKISVSALQSTTSWIVFPESIAFYASNNGKEWIELGKQVNKINPMENGHLIRDFFVNIDGEALYQYLRVDITSLKTCPKGHIAEGSSCWIFVDEIIVE